MAQISPFLSFFSCLFVRITLLVQWAAYLTWRENRNYDKGVCTPRKKYAKNLTYHQFCTQFSEQVILKPLQVSWGLSQAPGAGTPGEAAAVQAPNTTRGVAEDADTYRGSSHAMEWWKQVINMHHTVPKAEPAANECCAEGSGHGFAKFCVLGTPVKHNTEMQLGSCSHQRASRCKWGAGAGVPEPSVWCLPICNAVCQDWKVLCKERIVYGAGGLTLYLLCCWGSGALGKVQHLVHSGSQYTTKHSMATNGTLEVLGWVVILLRSQQWGALALKEGRQSVFMDGWIQLFRKDRPRQQGGRAALDVRANGVHEAVPWHRWRASWQLTGQDQRAAHGAWHCCGCLLQITWSGRDRSAG